MIIFLSPLKQGSSTSIEHLPLNGASPVFLLLRWFYVTTSIPLIPGIVFMISPILRTISDSSLNGTAGFR